MRPRTGMVIFLSMLPGRLPERPALLAQLAEDLLARAPLLLLGGERGVLLRTR